MTIGTQDDLEGLKRVGRVVSKVLKDMLDAIEPFLSTKTTFAAESADGWTLVGPPGTRSAQFEHTVAITRGAPIIVTRH